MKVYSITPDVDHYKKLMNVEGDPASIERIRELSFNGDKKTSYWRPVTLKWIEIEDVEEPSVNDYDSLKIPDIGYWLYGCVVLSPKATNILRPIFNEEAEFLPVSVGREDWAILNTINLQKAVKDIIPADYSTTWVDTIVFDETQIVNAKLFRAAERPARVLTSDASGSFKEVVDANGLTGLDFIEV